jgi:SAM-dependent methyltransferase
MIKIDDSWDKVWKNHEGLNVFGKILLDATEEEFKKILPMYIPKNYSIIEIGCGAGDTLDIFRRLGYKNVIGIDPSINSIRLCLQKGFVGNKDIFKNNSQEWKVKKDVVFSHGMLEHYDYVPMKEIARDFVRLARRFIVIVQPNPESLIITMRKKMTKSKWEWERPYTANDYIQMFTSLGFRIIYNSTINYFDEVYFMIFERGENNG